MSAADIFLAGAVRTPIGRFGGGLADLDAVTLGTVAGRTALERAGVAPGDVDHVVYGHARQAGCGPNPARQVGVAVGIPVERPAITLNQACLSGMSAIIEAVRMIRLGEAHVVLAGGMETMSRVPHMLDVRWGARMGHRPAIDLMYRDGFQDPISGRIMGETAETLATKYEISRVEQDEYAARSQNRAEAARRAGMFDDEIVEVVVPGRRGDVTVSADEHPRDGVTAAGLARLAPVFAADGSVTAGNSSGITDGASATVVLSAEAVRRLGVPVQARLRAYRVDGVPPEIMGIGPVPAVRGLLAAEHLELAAIERVELNEAFAAQVLAVDRELGLDWERTNVNGGAIALGHPIGCSGNRIVVTLVHEMRRSGAALGLATLCVSGGLGGALLLENAAAS